MAAEKTTAIVLRVTEFSESSCIATLMTRDFGKQTFIAKGARRPKSPFEAALDVLALCRIVFLHKSSGAMSILTEAKLERRFRNARKNLDWLYAAYYVVELMLSLVEEGDPHPELFDLAIRTIEELDSVSFADATKTNHLSPTEHASEMTAVDENSELNACLLRFEVGLLKNLGHFPLLSHCVSCGRERTTNNMVSFGLNAGGIVCPKCRPAQTNLIQVNPEAITAFTQLSQEFDSQELLDRDTDEELFDRDTDDLKQRNGKSSLVREVGSEYEMTFDTMNAASLTDVRLVMNRYMSVLMGCEPRAMGFLERLAKPINRN